jgi:hypothetical protein
LRKLMQRIVAASAFIASLLAAEEQHPGQQPGETPAAKVAPASNDASAAMIAAIKDNTEHMRKQMEQIRRTTDDDERARLIQDNIWLMTWQMEMIKRLRDLEMQRAERAGRDIAAGPSG